VKRIDTSTKLAMFTIAVSIAYFVVPGNMPWWANVFVGINMGIGISLIASKAFLLFARAVDSVSLKRHGFPIFGEVEVEEIDE
jgi:hypothetical protein